MSKTKTLHRCTSCAATSPKWVGQCSSCAEWNTLVEERVASANTGPSTVLASLGDLTIAEPLSLSEVDLQQLLARPTGVADLDRILGGGLVAGSVTLLGGEPGIGKSTLTLQIAAATASGGAKCLVVTGEESAEQVGRRAVRLGVNVDDVLLLAETDLERALSKMFELRPALVIVDSVQTMSMPGATGAPGTVAQVRDCAQALTAFAKREGIAVLLVGHVTKEGTLAGPRVLEHVVDTVLEFEGDRHHGLRFIRAAKHRFGATDDVAVLEMTERGLVTVPDASGLFLDDRRLGISGSIVAPVVQGRRALLVEIQALTVATPLPQPRRVAQGLDNGRLAVMLAVLARRCGITAATSNDVYASVVGGIRVDDPGSDLPVVLAVVSSIEDVPIPSDLVAIGEVGLGGEIRKVGHVAKRLSEAARMGFRKALVPIGTPEGPPGLELVPVSDLREVLALSFADVRVKRNRK